MIVNMSFYMSIYLLWSVDNKNNSIVYISYDPNPWQEYIGVKLKINSNASSLPVIDKKSCDQRRILHGKDGDALLF